MPKHLWQRVVLALCLCALASVAFFVLKYSLGRSDAGKVEEAKDLPEIGFLFARLDHEGPILYASSHHPHGTFSFSIWGRTTRSEIADLCRSLNLTLYPAGADSINSLAKSQETMFNARQRKELFRGGFEAQDSYIKGGNEFFHQVFGGFRESDGAFFLNLLEP